MPKTSLRFVTRKHLAAACEGNDSRPDGFPFCWDCAKDDASICDSEWAGWRTHATLRDLADEFNGGMREACPRRSSLISEVEVVEVNGVGILIPVSIILPVDGHTPPVLAGCTMRASDVEGVRLAVQGDGFENQIVVTVS